MLRIPIDKSELAARLDVFLRLRAHSKAQYRSLLENALIGIYRLTIDSRVVTANLAFARMLGYATTAEVVNTRVTDLVARTDPDRVVYLAELTARGRARWRGVDVVAARRRRDHRLGVGSSRSR